MNGRFRVAATLGFLISVLCSIVSAQAAPYKVVYTFCSDTKCTDGQSPGGGLIADTDHNLYGVTELGGNGNGTAFVISTHGQEKVLYSFCSKSNCTDGKSPYGALVRDKNGDLFGVTSEGGAHADGSLFKIANGKETVLYSFCSKASCADGAFPNSGLIQDKNGNFYGTTPFSSGPGVIYKISPSGKQTVLYSFSGNTSSPSSGVIMDASGAIYGEDATSAGADGEVYKLSPNGKLSTVYKFCAKSHCADGSGPQGGLVMDSQGDLYGTTAQGGSVAGSCGSAGCGTAFRLHLAANGWQEKVVQVFCSSGESTCSTGSTPMNGLQLYAKDLLMGTTYAGGASGAGVLFTMSLDGKESVLHNFCSGNNCTGGQAPNGDLLKFNGNHIVGTTTAGGTTNFDGVAYSVTQ